MSLTEAVQRAIVTRLRSDAQLVAMIGDRVFDDVPEQAQMPYVSLGPEDWQPIDDGVCLSGDDGTLQIDVWSRAPGRIECKRIVDRVAALFADLDVALPSPHPSARMRVSLKRIFDEVDQRHGVVQIDIATDHG